MEVKRLVELGWRNFKGTYLNLLFHHYALTALCSPFG